MGRSEPRDFTLYDYAPVGLAQQFLDGEGAAEFLEMCEGDQGDDSRISSSCFECRCSLVFLRFSRRSMSSGSPSQPSGTMARYSDPPSRLHSFVPWQERKGI